MNKVTFPLKIAPIYRRRIVTSQLAKGRNSFEQKVIVPGAGHYRFIVPAVLTNDQGFTINHNMSRLKTGIMPYNKQIRRIVFPSAATNLTLKKVKGQGHDMVPIERACHKDHACLISMLYL